MAVITLQSALKDYLRHRLSINAVYIASNEMEDARNWIKSHKHRLFTVDTVSRAWRKLRASGEVRTKEEPLPGSRQMTWKILEVGNNTPHRLRLR